MLFASLRVCAVCSHPQILLVGCFGCAEFEWGPSYASNATILEAALPQLRRLTHLMLPPGGGLQQLPRGKWLTSLCSLMPPVEPVAASLVELSAVQRLQHLALSAPPCHAVEDDATAVVRWAASQPALQRLELQMGRQGTVGRELLRMYLADLAHARPDVAVEVQYMCWPEDLH